VDPERVVQIRCAKPNGNVAFGTGYLVAPRLVLTAGHVLGDAAGAWPGDATMRLPDCEQRPSAAQVVWFRYDDVVDAALLLVDFDEHLVGRVHTGAVPWHAKPRSER
jgi:hypothetical protein